MRLITAIALATLLGQPSTAQDKPYPDNSAEMQKIAWLVGTWTAKGSYDQLGECTHVYRIEWPSTKFLGAGDPKKTNRNFLRTSYVMRSGDRVVWSDFSMFGWDKDNKRYTWFVFGMDGTIGTSIASTTKYDADGNAVKLVMDGETTGNSPWKKHRLILLRVDENTMIQEMMTWKDGKYVAMDGTSKTTFKRQLGAKAKKAAGATTEKK